MDQLKLRSLVFEKTGVKVDVDDPIFALVALNEAVLAEAVERHVALIDAASQELAAHARAAGGLTAAETRPARPGRPAVTAAEDELAEVFGEDAAAEPAPARAGSAPAGSDYAGASRPAAPFAAPPTPGRVIATQTSLFTPREWRLLAAAAVVAVLSALVVLAGQALFAKPGLTPAQAEAIATAEKLSKALDKVDPKMRSQLPADLQK